MLELSRVASICSGFLKPTSITKVQYLANGLSNENFLIRTKQHSYLLKCYKAHWPTVALKAQRELSMQHVCPAPVWLDSKNKLAAFDYIEGEITQARVTTPLLTQLIKVHAYTVDAEFMDIASELSLYQHLTVFKQYQEVMHRALHCIANTPKDIGFCHNDLVQENIIVNSLGAYLIDFEYAKNNDVYFDLAALAVSFKLSMKDKQTLLLDYKNLTQVKHFYLSLDKLNCYQLVYLLLCIGWYEQRDMSNQVDILSAQLDELLAVMKS